MHQLSYAPTVILNAPTVILNAPTVILTSLKAPSQRLYRAP